MDNYSSIAAAGAVLASLLGSVTARGADGLTTDRLLQVADALAAAGQADAARRTRAAVESYLAAPAPGKMKEIQ